MAIQQLSGKIQQANHIAVLTGAGVSTASGIPDFRSTGGFWDQDYDREYYMSNDYFRQNPIDFWMKYKSIFQMKLLGDYQPNRVHHFLKKLEDGGKDVSVITQNVDGLHMQAGNQRIIEYHGTLKTATCPTCNATYDHSYIISNETPRCETLFGDVTCNDVLKPDIVLFGDPITEHDRAEAIIDQADLLLVLGTSLFVMPFNFLPDYAKHNRNIPVAIINREPTNKDYMFDHVIHQDLTEAIKQLEDSVMLE